MIHCCRSLFSTLLLALLAASAGAQELPNSKYGGRVDPFYPIDSWWATPGEQRLGSGAPGPGYWQQRADYVIEVTLDDARQKISGRETVRYQNQSPHTLPYLWFQLDQNMYRPDSEGLLGTPAPNLDGRVPFALLRSILARESFAGGFDISEVADAAGNRLTHSIVGTGMRVDLPAPLEPGEATEIVISFDYRILDAKLVFGRGGYEFFEKDGNYLYEIAQWYPRVIAYTDYSGWQHEPYLGRGEFTVEFGNYDVRITAPVDMVVGATGELKNPLEVLSLAQRTRLADAALADKPVFIITPEEAKNNQANAKTTDRALTKTWHFTATNVRDFAFAASRKFIWDAVGHNIGDRMVMAMSYYPIEAEPLWSQYSTAAITHTLDVYSRFAFDYPYPVAISVNGPVFGMEYPMICFNGPRPEADGTYSKATKYALISVIIHEVGHNWFPMIVNSDERRWTWMDEGLNTYLQFLAEQEWEDDYPSTRGEPENITAFMRSHDQRPIMTQSESLLQFGNVAYAKPATALNILRETILGRELFDFAFKEYARRWRFKRPTPEDFFRTIEDASGVDLDWFWRGWFYSTDHVDVAIESVKLYQIDTADPDENAEQKRRERKQKPESISQQRNEPITKRVDLEPGLKDFYNDYDELHVSEDDRKNFRKFIDGLNAEERKLITRKTNFYIVNFKNVGGLVTPIILTIRFDDASSERLQIPASIWRQDPRSVSKLIITDKVIEQLELDPNRQTADTDHSNDHWPPKLVPSRFKLFKDEIQKNPMQKANDLKSPPTAESDPAAQADRKTEPAEPEKSSDRVEDGVESGKQTLPERARVKAQPR
ncbi:MAG: M1 family metallopeptidase [Planctomycetaceae bacterium]